MNKKGLLPRTWITLVVIIGMLVAASAFWIGAWNNVYSPVENANLSSSYNKISEVSSITEEMETKLQTETKTSSLGFLDFVVQGGYQVLQIVLAVPNIIVGFVRDVGGEFGIPEIFINGFILLVTVGAIFGIVGAIFRRKT